MTGNKQVLVVYYSLSGNTARVATDLAARLDADLESVHDRHHGTGFWSYLKCVFDAWREVPASIDPIKRNPADYSLVVIGTPVWVWKITPAIRAYLETTRGKHRQVAFFITSGDTDIAQILPALEGLAQHKALASMGFNARELKDAADYEKRMSTFVAALKRPLAPAQIVPGALGTMPAASG